jgi:hypothetical protein
MLERLANYTRNIHQFSQADAKALYARAMVIALSVGDIFDDLMPPEGRIIRRERVYQYAFAAQELAYAYRLHHGEPIGQGAIDPERFDHVYSPPGTVRPVLSGKQLEEEIIRFLRRHHPQTLPAELRD